MINAIIKENIPENRLICLTKAVGDDEDKIYLRLTKEGEIPDFYSRKDVVKGEEVKIAIGHNKKWKAEAFDDIPAGVLLVSIGDGKVARAEGRTIEAAVGYSLHKVKAGEVVEFVFQPQTHKAWVDKVNKVIEGIGGDGEQ